jgi:plasmid stabilization system protein ParE
MRDDIRPGLRITHYKKRTIIAFAVLDDTVAVLGIYYGGQNYEEKLDDTTDGDQQ